MTLLLTHFPGMLSQNYFNDSTPSSVQRDNAYTAVDLLVTGYVLGYLGKYLGSVKGGIFLPLVAKVGVGLSQAIYTRIFIEKTVGWRCIAVRNLLNCVSLSLFFAYSRESLKSPISLSRPLFEMAFHYIPRVTSVSYVKIEESGLTPLKVFATINSCADLTISYIFHCHLFQSPHRYWALAGLQTASMPLSWAVTNLGVSLQQRFSNDPEEHTLVPFKKALQVKVISLALILGLSLTLPASIRQYPL